MGAYSGFNVGWANASTIGTAQPIAELPIFSGFSVRVVLNIINFAICYFFTIRYMKSIKADPKKSLNYEDGMSVADYMGAGKVAHAASRMPGDPCIRILNDLTEHRLDRSVGNPGIAPSYIHAKEDLPFPDGGPLFLYFSPPVSADHGPE